MIEQETAAELGQTACDYDSWFRNIETLRQEIRASQSDKLPPVDAVGILRDIRDGEDE